MKVELAENQNEITLHQYQKLMVLQERTDLDVYSFNKRKVKIFTGLTYREISAIGKTELDDLLKTIDKGLNTEVKFEPRFKMNDVEFGFIPNFDDMKAKEYFDLSTYDTTPETLHKLMAILFRPIKNKLDGEYEIINYQGTKEWAEVMRQVPLNIVNGALVFFYNLANDLEIYTLKFTALERAKEKRAGTLKSGGGIRQYIRLLKGSRGSLNMSKT